MCTEPAQVDLAQHIGIGMQDLELAGTALEAVVQNIDQLAAGLDLNSGTGFAKLMTKISDETKKHVADIEPEGGAANDRLLWEETLRDGAVNGIKVECTQIRQQTYTVWSGCGIVSF